MQILLQTGLRGLAAGLTLWEEPADQPGHQRGEDRVLDRCVKM